MFPMRPLLIATLALVAAFTTGALLAQDDDDDTPKPAKKDEKKATKPDELPEEPLPRARALLERGRHDEAADLARTLVAADPQAKAPRQLLCELYLKTGMDHEADEATAG